MIIEENLKEQEGRRSTAPIQGISYDRSICKWYLQIKAVNPFISFYSIIFTRIKKAETWIQRGLECSRQGNLVCSQVTVTIMNDGIGGK